MLLLTYLNIKGVDKMKILYRVLCFDNNTDVRNSVCEITETDSLTLAITRLIKFQFTKKDTTGEPISSVGLWVNEKFDNYDEEPIYKSKSVRLFERGSK